MFSALDYSIEAEKRRKQLLKPKGQVGQVGAQPATSPSPYGETPPPPLSIPKPGTPPLAMPRPQTGYPNVGLVDGTAGGVVPPRPYQPMQIPGRPAQATPEYPKSGSMANDVATMGGTLLRRAAVGYAAGSAGVPGGGVAGVVGALSPQPARPSAPIPLAIPQPGQPVPPPLSIPRPQPGASYGSQNPAGQGQAATIPATGGQDADRQRMQNQLLALKDRRMAYQRQEFALPAGDPGREQYRQAQVTTANEIRMLEQAVRYNPDAAAPAQRSIVDVGNSRTALRQKGDAMLEAEKQDLMLKVIQKSIPPEAMARAQARIAEINNQRAQLDERLPDLHGQDLDRTTAGVNSAAQGQFQRSQSEGASRYANAQENSARTFKERADKFEYDAAMRRAELARVNADTRASEQSGTDSGAAAIKAEADRVEAQTRLEKSKTDAGMAKTLGTVQADENRETEFASSQVGRAADVLGETLSKMGGPSAYVSGDNRNRVNDVAREWNRIRSQMDSASPEERARIKVEVSRRLSGNVGDPSLGFTGWLRNMIDWPGGEGSIPNDNRQATKRYQSLMREMMEYLGD